MSMITYAQAMEDVLLHRALHRVPPSEGFYIDVGGYHPIYDSVTKHFYDHGWKGINIEPVQKQFAEFERERPRDVNLRVAVSDFAGEATFFEMDQTSTLEARFADPEMNNISGQYLVPVTTLAEICREHVYGEVHFLKIDVEGHEAAVIRGADFKRFRPWILVIEAVEPNKLDRPTYGEWDDAVLAAGYTFAFTDVLNRYYVANEHRDLIQFLGTPADDFRKARDIWCIHEVERQRDDYKRKLDSALAQLSQMGERVTGLES